MNSIESIAFALDPKNIPSFLLDWEVTKVCNLDCSYCGTGVDGGHDNTTKHPSLTECLKTLDFMYEYVDLYMKHKKPNQRKVILNVYGGESLFHPDIVEILEHARQKYLAYKEKWYLTISCTTNAIVGPTQWEKIVPLIDNFTLSYHSENLPKQKDIFKSNALYLKAINKPFRTVIMMHDKSEYWQDGLQMVEYLKENNIAYVTKALDNEDRYYTQEQFKTLKTFWVKNVSTTQQCNYSDQLDTVGSSCDKVSSLEEGRACCGGRKLSINGDLKSSLTFVPRQGFQDWYCSVNWFFLFVQQLTGNVYTNKDCRMSFSGGVAPIGNIADSQKIITELDSQLKNKNMPVIQCAKSVCVCGFCAPKAQKKIDFDNLMSRHIIDNPLKIN
jgi:Radical SAM superfamily